MALTVVIFEDDKELADLLKEMMDMKGYDVHNLYSLKKKEWLDADIVLADYRNKIVSFQDVVKAMSQDSIPVLAISGMETGFSPQLVKPFTIEELESKILKVINDNGGAREKRSGGFLRKLGF